MRMQIGPLRNKRVRLTLSWRSLARIVCSTVDNIREGEILVIIRIQFRPISYQESQSVRNKTLSWRSLVQICLSAHQTNRMLLRRHVPLRAQEPADSQEKKTAQESIHEEFGAKFGAIIQVAYQLFLQRNIARAIQALPGSSERIAFIRALGTQWLTLLFGSTWHVAVHARSYHLASVLSFV